MAKVAVIKSHPQHVHDDIAHIMEAAECDNFLDKNKQTILKDNISWHLMMPGANTTPWQLEGTIQYLLDKGYKRLCAVHNNTVVTRPQLGQAENRLAHLYSKYEIEEKLNFDGNDMKWIRFKPQSEMLVLDSIFRDGIYIPDYFIDKNIVHLPTLKCHIYTQTTGAIKNAFGGLLNKHRHYAHSDIHKTLVDLLAIQKEIHPGIFAVMDGTTAGNGPGPRTHNPVIADYILASGDQVAIDAVAAHLMGFDPFSIDYIKIAHERGLGCGDINKIDIIGEEIKKVNLHFTVGNNAASLIGNLLWFSPFKIFQKLFFRTPLVYFFIFASEVFHDKLWYPLKGVKRYRKWLETEWAKLFLTYS